MQSISISNALELLLRSDDQMLIHCAIMLSIAVIQPNPGSSTESTEACSRLADPEVATNMCF
jgi:hypothetical protein